MCNLIYSGASVGIQYNFVYARFNNTNCDSFNRCHTVPSVNRPLPDWCSLYGVAVSTSSADLPVMSFLPRYDLEIWSRVCVNISHRRSSKFLSNHIKYCTKDLNTAACIKLMMSLHKHLVLDAPCGAGTPSSPLVHLLPHLFPFSLFSFFHWLYLFSSFVHPFPFYQNSPTPFPGWRS